MHLAGLHVHKVMYPSKWEVGCAQAVAVGVGASLSWSISCHLLVMNSKLAREKYEGQGQCHLGHVWGL